MINCSLPCFCFLVQFFPLLLCPSFPFCFCFFAFDMDLPIHHGNPSGNQTLIRQALVIAFVDNCTNKWVQIYNDVKRHYGVLSDDCDHGLGRLSLSTNEDTQIRKKARRRPFSARKLPCQICGDVVGGQLTGDAIHLFRGSGLLGATFIWEGNETLEYQQQKEQEKDALFLEFERSGLKAIELFLPSNVIHGCQTCNSRLEKGAMYFEQRDATWYVMHTQQDFLVARWHGLPVGDHLQSQFSNVPNMPQLLELHAKWQKVCTHAVRSPYSFIVFV